MLFIEQDEMEGFIAILRHHHFSETDFELRETDTTDPQSDEIYGMQGYATVTRKSTHVTKEYPLGYDTAWLNRFRKDLENGVFG
ncbi:MAG: transcriptional regulator [Pseudomonadota bacterium]